MIQRPPSTTRTDKPFPDTALFRSKAPAGIECKIDRVELDVRDSMNECCAPLDGTQRALRHIMRMNQQRPWRPARYRARIGIRRPGHCALELGNLRTFLCRKIGRAHV